MQDLFITEPEQLSFNFELMDIYKEDMSLTQKISSSNKKESIKEQINIKGLLEILNDLTKNYSKSYDNLLNSDETLEHFQIKYKNKIKAWDKQAMEVIQLYGLSVVLNELNTSDFYFSGLKYEGQDVKVPINYGVARVLVVLNEHINIEFLNKVKKNIDLNYIQDTDGNILDVSILDMLAEEKSFNEMVKYILYNVYSISTIQKVETANRIFTLIKNQNAYSLDSFCDIYAIIKDKDGYNPMLVMLSTIFCSSDKLFNNIKANFISRACNDIFNKYQIGKGFNSPVFHVLHHVFKKIYSLTSDDFETRVQKMLDINAINAEKALVFSAYLPCSQEFREKICKRLKTDSFNYNFNFIKNKRRKINLFLEIIESRNDIALKQFLSVFNISWSNKNIKTSISYIWPHPPYFNNSPVPILKENWFKKSIKNSALDVLEVIFPMLNKNQSQQLTSNIFCQIFNDASLEKNEKQQFIGKIANLIPNEIFSLSMSQAKEIMSNEKSLTPETNDFLKQVKEYGVLIQYNTKNKTQNRRSIL